MGSTEKIAIAILAASIIIMFGVALWILEAPRRIKDWVERHK
jgi:hypothetical protein